MSVLNNYKPSHTPHSYRCPTKNSDHIGPHKFLVEREICWCFVIRSQKILQSWYWSGNGSVNWERYVQVGFTFCWWQGQPYADRQPSTKMGRPGFSASFMTLKLSAMKSWEPQEFPDLTYQAEKRVKGQMQIVEASCVADWPLWRPSQGVCEKNTCEVSLPMDRIGNCLIGSR